MKRKQKEEITEQDLKKLFSPEDEPHREDFLTYLKRLIADYEDSQNASMYASIGIYIAIIIGAETLCESLFGKITLALIFIISAALYSAELYRRNCVINKLRDLHEKRRGNKILNLDVKRNLEEIDKVVKKWRYLRWILYISAIIVTLIYIIGVCWDLSKIDWTGIKSLFACID